MGVHTNFLDSDCVLLASIRFCFVWPIRLDIARPPSLNLSTYIHISKMFRVKVTRRNVKRAVSPLQVATDLSGANVIQENGIKKDEVGAPKERKHESLEKNMVNFFEAESAAVSLSKPWLRLKRGLRLQKYLN